MSHSVTTPTSHNFHPYNSVYITFASEKRNVRLKLCLVGVDTRQVIQWVVDDLIASQ